MSPEPHLGVSKGSQIQQHTNGQTLLEQCMDSMAGHKRVGQKVLHFVMKLLIQVGVLNIIVKTNYWLTFPSHTHECGLVYNREIAGKVVYEAVS